MGVSIAGLFAAGLYRMYLRYAEKQGWKTEMIEGTEGTAGGMKEVIYAVRGEGAFGMLRWESGVHRVQRVPATESQGRVHTSAVTVAVLPEAEDVDVEINDADLKIDVYRAQGPGGQSVNTTDSAVRVTHLPTGIVAQCQDEKSQHKNKAKAMKVLMARMLQKQQEERQEQLDGVRRSMVGSGDRSERIRTYNYPQGRVTDHRIGLTLYKLDSILQGEIDEIIEETCCMAEQDSCCPPHQHDRVGFNRYRSTRASERLLTHVAVQQDAPVEQLALLADHLPPISILAAALIGAADRD